MKKYYILAMIILSTLVSCNPSSQNQGYDSGPTTKEERGSEPSSPTGNTRDSIAADTAGHEGHTH